MPGTTEPSCDRARDPSCRNEPDAESPPVTKDASLDAPHDAAPRDASRRDATPSDGAPTESGARDAMNDSAFDGSLAPDCRCADGPYFVDANVGGQIFHLGEPYRFYLACEETAPQLLHNPCGPIYRLTACEKPDNGPPCLYVAVDSDTGPLIGSYTDETGQTWELRTGSIAPGMTLGSVATGTFSATYVDLHADASLVVTGSYSACAPSFPACRR
jgi:hypothetical protein